MSLRGRVEASGLLDVMQLLGRRTGVLAVRTEHRAVDVMIREGAAVQARLTGPGSGSRGSAGVPFLGATGLLDRLARRGDMRARWVDELLHRQRSWPTGAGVGQLAVEAGATDEEAVRAALRRQLRERLIELFFVRSGDWSFTGTDVPRRPLEPEGVRLEPLILAGLDAATDWGRIQAAQPDPGAVLRPNRTLPEPPDPFAEAPGEPDVGPEARALYAALEEAPKTYARLLTETALDGFAVRRAAWLLLSRGLARADHPTEPARPPPPPLASLADVEWTELAAQMSRLEPRRGDRGRTTKDILAPTPTFPPWCFGPVRYEAHHRAPCFALPLPPATDLRPGPTVVDAVLSSLRRTAGPRVLRPLDLETGPGGALRVEAPGGEPLARWAARTDPELTERAEVCLQVAEAVEQVHRAGAVHGRLGPGSFLYVPERGAVLADLPETLLLPFAPGWRPRGRVAEAPEVAAGGAPDVRADVYALGYVFHLVLFGQPPTDDEVGILGDFPGVLEMIVRRCLSLEPDRRYGQVARLRAALEVAAEALVDDAGAAGAEAER